MALQIQRSGPPAGPIRVPAQTELGGFMSDVVYRSEVRIERVKGPVRKAYLPAESEPVIFGVHSAVAEPSCSWCNPQPAPLVLFTAATAPEPSSYPGPSIQPSTNTP